MIDTQNFRQNAHRIADWIADYYENIEKYPVKSQAQPGDIYNNLPTAPPQQSESFETILHDVEQIIMPGVTHWQSPGFHAYFPANGSFPAILAEMITAGLGLQCMKWDTSPAAAELEERVMRWLIEVTGLPPNFDGVIQDTASTATLCALLSAREKKSNYQINESGFSQQPVYRVYCSGEAHSSIERAVKIAGLGRTNLVKIETDDQQRMKPECLKTAIENDIKQGFTPLCVVAALGTTGTTAIDPLADIAPICKQFEVWLHVDAAFAGSLLILPEYQWMIKGIESADSLVFNPHKWLFTNFDCSAYFVKDKNALTRTFSILPEYLRTANYGKVNDYCDWGIQLGRRFRALKLWFVIRSFGIEGLQKKLRLHLQFATDFAAKIEQHPNFELTAPVTMSLVCFRYKPKGMESNEQLNGINEQLLKKINQTGTIYLTHTKIKDVYTLRLVAANTHLEQYHIERAWEIIRELADYIDN